MTYASISIDRREEYYKKVAPLITKNPLGFYCRAERGKRVQASIKPKDLTLEHLLALGKKKGKIIWAQFKPMESKNG